MSAVTVPRPFLSVTAIQKKPRASTIILYVYIYMRACKCSCTAANIKWMKHLIPVSSGELSTGCCFLPLSSVCLPRPSPLFFCLLYIWGSFWSISDYLAAECLLSRGFESESSSASLVLTKERETNKSAREKKGRETCFASLVLLK